MNRSYRPINPSNQRNTRNNSQQQQQPAAAYKPLDKSFVKVETYEPQPVQKPVPAPVPVPAVEPEKPETMETTDENNVKIVKFQARGKVSAKVKRQRANRRLRRLLCPKTAVIALHELCNKGTPGSGEIEIQVSDAPTKSQFKAETVYQGKIYTGFGQSKQAARNNVAEKVLRDMVIEKMKKHPRKEETKDANGSGDIEMAENEEDEVPMTHLASYALHKLFVEWSEQGFDVPDFRQAIQVEAVKEAAEKGDKKLPAPRAALPANAASLHPAMLLQQMRPGTQYQDLGSQGTVPNVIHCMGVTVDTKQFIGNGKSKKIARKEAARFACQELFGVTFNPEVLNGNNA